jgi:hypothetical protein
VIDELLLQEVLDRGGREDARVRFDVHAEAVRAMRPDSASRSCQANDGPTGGASSAAIAVSRAIRMTWFTALWAAMR